MSNNNSFGGKLRKVLASVCSLFVGASGVSQAGKFDVALGNKRGTIAHFSFGSAGKSVKGTTEKIFGMLKGLGGFGGLLNGVCGNIPNDSWGYASYDEIFKKVKGAGVKFHRSDEDIVIKLIHDNIKLPGGGTGSADAVVLRLSLDDFDYIIENYQKERLPEFIKEFNEVDFAGGGLIDLLDHLKKKGIEQRNFKGKVINSVEDLRRFFPNRYCASMLALDLFSYIFDVELNLTKPYELIDKIFNKKGDCVKLSSGVLVLRPEIFQDAFIRRWGYLDDKPIYELKRKIDIVCENLNVSKDGTVGEKLKRVSERVSALLKNGEEVVKLQEKVVLLKNELEEAKKNGSDKSELQNQLKEAKKELKKLSPSAAELDDIGDALKGYGNENETKVQKVKNLLAEVNKWNDEFQKLQETKLGKIAKWGSYPAVFAAGYLISKFVPNGGKKLNNVNKVENKNKNKGPNRDKKAKKRNNVKKN